MNAIVVIKLRIHFVFHKIDIIREDRVQSALVRQSKVCNPKTRDFCGLTLRQSSGARENEAPTDF